VSTPTIEALHDFIRRHRYGVVSSRATDGAPQSALVGIAVAPSLKIYFDTLGTTRKARNLRADPRISIVIGWENEQSLQYEGIAFEPKGAELEGLKRIYYAAWPDGPTREAWPQITWFCVRPRWIRFSDFNRVDDAVLEVTF
jgi:general stress protein 26